MHGIEKISFTIVLAFVSCVLATGNDMKDAGQDREAHSDRGGQLWFGPRLGKRSLRLSSEDNRQAFFKLLEAADTLKYYYDQLPYYESQADEPASKISKKVIFTPKLGRSLSPYEEKFFENVEFTPRLGRRLADDIPATPPDEELYRPDPEQIDSRTKYFSPRLGRTMSFSPRLGRELSYGYFITVLSLATSVIVLSVNTEDIRTIAEQIVSNNAVSNIYEVIKDVIEHNKHKKSNKEPLFRGEVSVTKKKEIKYNREEISRSKSNKTHYEVNLNELVEQVKQKLQRDVLRMTADGGIKTIQDTNERLNKLLSSSDTFDVLEDDQVTRITVTEDQNDNHSAQNKTIDNEVDKNEADKQNLDQKDVQPIGEEKLGPKVKDDLAAIPKVKINHRLNKQRKKIKIKHKRKVKNAESVTITAKKILRGFNMIQEYNNSTLDSIDEEEGFAETVTEAPKTALQNPYVQIKQTLNQRISKTDYNPYEDETTNYNKKKSKIKTNYTESKYHKTDNKFKQQLNKEGLQKVSSGKPAENIEQQIKPYAEQIQELEFAGKSGQVTDTLEAEKEHVTTNIYPSTYLLRLNERNKMKKFINQQQTTVWSKREFFRMRTSEDSVELPVNTKKHGQIPVIPAEDWVKDNFENL